MLKAINFLLALMFMAFSYVQLNDPDPVLWIVIYGLMAVVCVMAAFDYYIKRLMLVMSIGYIGVASTLVSSCIIWIRSPDKAMLFDDIAKMQNIYIEESREFLGLMICLVILVFYWVRRSKLTTG